MNKWKTEWKINKVENRIKKGGNKGKTPEK